ncbi:MAG TPA: MgtC/SapB family protein [Ktedonobacterales bacterium]
MFPVISHQDAVIRLVVATVTGSLIGPECEIGEQSAGLQTHALVSLADALFLLLVIKPIERRLFPQRFQQIVRVKLKDTEGISDVLSRISTEA